MSVKIKVSYTEDEELARVIRLLSPLGKKWKVAKNQKGSYKKAYTEERRANSENNGDKCKTGALHNCGASFLL